MRELKYIKTNMKILGGHMPTVHNMLHRQQNPYDEFPTPEKVMQYGEELMEWKERGLFKGKTVFMPCDDYRWSGFSKWFIPRMKEYGIKKLICRSYEQGKHGKLYINESGKEYIADTEGEGSFLEPEAEKYKQEADFILTNPPFSIKKIFLDWCKDRPYIVIVPIHSLCAKFIFDEWRRGKFYMTAIGKLFPEAPTAWATNIPSLLPSKYIRASSQFKEGAYSKYDDYDAIDIPKTTLIPADYKGIMGVPVTIGAYSLPDYYIFPKLFGPHINGKQTFKRIFIQRKNETQNTPLPRSTTPSLFD